MTSLLDEFELLWSNLPSQVCVTLGSMEYIKRVCFPMTLANIVHNRINYDSEPFSVSDVNDIPYRSFTNTIPKNHRVRRLYRWMRIVLKRWDIYYKREMTFSIRNKETQETLESYHFSVTPEQDDMNNPNPLFNLPIIEVVYKTARMVETINLLSSKAKYKEADVAFSIGFNYINKPVTAKCPTETTESGRRVLVEFSAGFYSLKIDTDCMMPNLDD